MGEFCRKMKSTTDALRGLGYPVPEHDFVLNIVRGLPSSYKYLRTLITHQRPTPTFLHVRDALTWRSSPRVSILLP
jgi:hypothetical protein